MRPEGKVTLVLRNVGEATPLAVSERRQLVGELIVHGRIRIAQKK